MSDPEVVRASRDFVRVIVRRPHAYFYIQELGADQGGISGATAAGVVMGDGTRAHIPGAYFMDAEGALLGATGLAGANAKADLLAMMRELSTP